MSNYKLVGDLQKEGTGHYRASLGNGLSCRRTLAQSCITRCVLRLLLLEQMGLSLISASMLTRKDRAKLLIRCEPILGRRARRFSILSP